VSNLQTEVQFLSGAPIPSRKKELQQHIMPYAGAYTKGTQLFGLNLYVLPSRVLSQAESWICDMTRALQLLFQVHLFAMNLTAGYNEETVD
jgi:hypothetical protein